MAHQFDPRNIIGLSQEEAGRRLRADGFNELPSGRQRGIVATVVDVLREPMFLMLVACGALYVLMGEAGDAAVLLGFVFVVMGITVVQERRTERALHALRDLSSPRALVVRDGKRERIAGREVVRGDFVILSEGDRVPADGVLRQCLNLAADESLLTGESFPVRKTASPAASAMGRAGGDDTPFVFSGSLVTAGQGVAEILATGPSSEMGRIGRALESVKTEETPLQRETGRLVRNLAVLGLSLCLLVVVVYGFTRGNTAGAWARGVLVGITMAMATLPEEFPVVLTIFLALGAWRISRSRVLTRRMPVIETLGAATVLCTDKTGTLTLNRMSVRRLSVDGHVFDTGDGPGTGLPERYHTLLEYGILASKHDPFDPMERALRELGREHLARTEHLHDNWTLVREYPLSPGLMALSHIWRSPGGGSLEIAAKGAPEGIADLCHLDGRRKRAMAEEAAAMAAEGLRVIGIARASSEEGTLPREQHDFAFRFIGLIGLADPVRPTVPCAIAECRAAGIRVVMITGDYPETARTIGRRIGLGDPDRIITGPELDAMDDAELARRIPSVNIFARAVPEQKLRIVNALKANREVVAMTGDGVNDAPALKAAHIGIAMGGRGTDVAREASGMVLLDDDFSSIVEAVKMGRRIFDNIRKAGAFILAVHVPIAGLSILPVFFSDWPLLLLPMHVAFLELIIDPACSVIFEAEGAEPDVMTRPPRGPGTRLFRRRSVILSLLQGASVLAIVVGVFLLSGLLGHPGEASRRGLVFVTLVVASLCTILANRSWTRSAVAMFREPNGAVWWVVAGATACLALIVSVPFLRALFRFSALDPGDILLCVAAGIISIVWFELLKLFRLRF